MAITADASHFLVTVLKMVSSVVGLTNDACISSMPPHRPIGKGISPLVSVVFRRCHRHWAQSDFERHQTLWHWIPRSSTTFAVTVWVMCRPYWCCSAAQDDAFAMTAAARVGNRRRRCCHLDGFWVKTEIVVSVALYERQEQSRVVISARVTVRHPATDWH
jgi:hypothetical protein